MAALFEGDFNGKAVKAEFGPDAKSGKLKCRVIMEITEGQRAGTQVAYEGNLAKEYISFTKRDLIALGWQGKTTATIASDIMSAGKVVPFQTRIAEKVYEDTGKRSQWTSVRSIGYSAPPLRAAGADDIRNADSWFADAGDQPPPRGGNGGGGDRHPNAPGNDDDLPFASADFASEPSAIAAILRRSI